MSRRYLVTGGAGFIGSNFIRQLLAAEPDAEVTNLDLLTYAGVKATVDELDTDDRHRFVHGDIRVPKLVNQLVATSDIIVNFAAESHVDRSITGPTVFLETNIIGTGVLLDAARKADIARVHVSTDEVYGSISTGYPTEEAPLRPSSPYSASKAAADLLVQSYAVTYGYGAMITRCTNNYGPYQFPEKVIPLFATNLFEGKKVPLYGDGKAERDWLHVEDHCAAIRTVLDAGTPGEIYNVGADAQLANIEVARAILGVLGLDESSIEYVSDRPGHDLRYAVDSTKVRELGWKPQHEFEDRLAETIDWYRAREDWWRPLKAK